MGHNSNGVHSSGCFHFGLDFEVESEERKQNKQQIDNTFFNLSVMHINLKNNFELNKYFDGIYNLLLSESENQIRQLGNLMVLHDQKILRLYINILFYTPK